MEIKSFKAGDYITKMSNPEVDGQTIDLPAEILAVTCAGAAIINCPNSSFQGRDYAFLAKYSQDEQKLRDHQGGCFGIPNHVITETKTLQDVVQEKLHSMNAELYRETLKEYAVKTNETHMGMEIWETTKLRKLQKALKRDGHVHGWWEVTTFYDKTATFKANLRGHQIIIRLPQEDKQEEDNNNEDKMSDKQDNSFKKQVKSDLEKVAYRQGARKITGISHAVILHMLRRQGFDDTKLAVVLEALETDIGRAALSYGLGKVSERVKPDHEVAQNLAEEFRVSGMDLGVEAGLDKVAQKGLELMPAGMALLSAIEKTAREGLTLESVQGFANVDSQLPQELLQELDRMDSIKSRIETVPVPKQASAEDFIAELEVQAEEEEEEEVTVPTAKYASCS